MLSPLGRYPFTPSYDMPGTSDRDQYRPLSSPPLLLQLRISPPPSFGRQGDTFFFFFFFFLPCIALLPMAVRLAPRLSKY